MHDDTFYSTNIRVEIQTLLVMSSNVVMSFIDRVSRDTFLLKCHKQSSRQFVGRKITVKTAITITMT